MSSKYPKFSLWLSHSSLILATLLLSTSGAVARSIPTAPIMLAQSSQLEELPTEEQIQQQIEAEANRFFGRTLAQFNLIILVTLVLLLTGAIAALWLLRKAVIREVAHLVGKNLQELNKAKSELDRISQDLQQILQTARQTSDRLEEETENFQQELKQKRKIISGLLSELNRAKQQGL